MSTTTARDSSYHRATDDDHRREAERQLDEALKRIAWDTKASVRVGEGPDAYWDRVPTWGAADLSMARIVAEVAMRNPGITVTSIQSSDWKYPVPRESGLVIGIRPAGYLCYLSGDRLEFRTGYDGDFPPHLRGTVSATVGDDVRGAFEALAPRLDALREWGEENVRRNRAKREAEDAARKAREESGEAMGMELARLIMSGDALALADAVNAAVVAMARGDVGLATRMVEERGFHARMTGMPPFALGMDGIGWRSRRLMADAEMAEGGRD